MKTLAPLFAMIRILNVPLQNVVYLYIMKYYSALKRKDILMHTTICKKFEDIMLSKLSQS